ncbi:MAG: formate dehydrogenase subunit alpha [Syntrophobacterales bacterium]
MAGLAASFGSGAMTNSIEELEESDCILVTGSNTSETHPVIATFIKRAARLKGKTLIVIDPRRLYLTRHAAIWLRQRPGSDAAVLNGLMHVIIRDNLHDQAYIAERTENFEALRDTVSRYTPEVVERISGVPAQDLEKAARLYAAARRAAICYAMGITQHITGTDNVKSLANLAMLCGNVGIRGGGVNPLRGQNNVQGACDMGGLPNVFTGYQSVTEPENRWKMERVWGVRNLPDWAGMTMTEMLPSISEGKIKTLYIIGENPVISEADTEHALNPLQELDFLVVQDLFLTETGKLADVVLPASSFAEKDGTFTNTERRVLRVRRAVLPVRNSLPDWRILCELSQRLDYPMDYTTPEEIFEEIRRVTPAYAGISYERLEREGSLQWPCPHPDHPGTRYLHKDRFTSGKGQFFPIEYREPAELPDEEYPLILTTGRVLYQYHTGTMSRRAPGLVEKAPECRVEIAAGDAEKFGVGDGEMVWVKSRRGQIKARAMVSTKAIPGTIFVPFHYYEAAVNKLTIAALDPVAKIPAYKVCAVKLEKMSEIPGVREVSSEGMPLRKGVA